MNMAHPSIDGHQELTMKKLGGGGLLIVGIGLVLLGWLIKSGIVEFLLDIIGFIVIAAGVILAVYALVKMFSGDKSGASEY